MHVLRIGQRIGEQRVAVGRRPRHIGDADRSVAAGLVLDHNVLADVLLQHRREHTRRDIGQSARRKRNDDGNGAVRIALRLRASCKHQRHGQERQRKPQSCSHVHSRGVAGVELRSIGATASPPLIRSASTGRLPLFASANRRSISVILAASQS